MADVGEVSMRLNEGLQALADANMDNLRGKVREMPVHAALEAAEGIGAALHAIGEDVAWVGTQTGHTDGYLDEADAIFNHALDGSSRGDSGMVLETMHELVRRPDGAMAMVVEMAMSIDEKAGEINTTYQQLLSQLGELAMLRSTAVTRTERLITGAGIVRVRVQAIKAEL